MTFPNHSDTLFLNPQRVFARHAVKTSLGSVSGSRLGRDVWQRFCSSCLAVMREGRRPLRLSKSLNSKKDC